jgi:hypothetical protein
MATFERVRALAITLPRTTEAYVRGCPKFRVRQIVYLGFSHDLEIVEFAFPREWRPVIVESEPHKFMLPKESDLRFNWLRGRLAAIDDDEMRDLVTEAWRMVVPQRVAADYDAGLRLRASALTGAHGNPARDR